MYSEMEYTDPGEGLWYDNDLQLAAELGKTLLERNRELESQLKLSQQTQGEQAKEIDLLTKQLDVLRNVNDSRMRIYEEVDRNLQELEKTNTKFRLEIRSDKEKIKRFTETVENLEIKCAELNTKLEEIQSTERQRKRQDRQRTWNSVPSLVESTRDGNGKFDYLGFPSISFKPGDKKALDPIENEHIRKLKETLKSVRIELAREQRKREEAESKVVTLTQANTDLTSKVTRLEQDQEEIALSEQESFAPDVKALQVMCRSCRSETSSIADAELLEHDIEEVPRGQLVRLKCGGSAYGSRESLHQIGLEADDLTMESGSDILVSGNVINWSMDDGAGKGHGPDDNVSLLGELEAQYRKLVTKYELLIEAKSKRAAAKEVSTQDNLDDPPTATTSTSGVTMRNNGSSRDSRTSWRKSLNLAMDLCSPLDPIDGHFENGPPEYKRLFKEIFETLQRSVDYEEELATQSSSNSSPEETIKGLGETSG